MTPSTLVRKKDTGEPGNRGEFAATAHADSGLTLSADDAPPGDLARPQPELTVPTWAIQSARNRVEAANRRLERAGITDRFEMAVSEQFLRTRWDGRQEMAATITLSHPTISYDGWQFVAALDTTPDGTMIARTRPGEDLNGWRPQEALCEHCNTRRHRATTYVLRHTDGTIRQVGSTCMQDFLGVKPAGLWTLDADLAEQIDDDVTTGYGNHQADTYTPTGSIIALALAASDGGRQYRSASSWSDDPSTAQVVKNALWFTPRTSEGREELAALQAAADRYTQDGTVQQVLEHAASLTGDSDYATNLRALAAAEHIGPKHVGIVASAVTVWAKEQQLKVERESRVPAAKGWLGPKGTKIAGRTATVEKVRYLDNPYDPWGGVTTLVIMRSDTGHTLKWFATGRHDLDAGQQLNLTGGTVKENDTYEGTDQTVLTRVKYALQQPDTH